MGIFTCPVCGKPIPTDKEGKNRLYMKDHLHIYHSKEIMERYGHLFAWTAPILDQLDIVIDDVVLVEN